MSNLVRRVKSFTIRSTVDAKNKKPVIRKRNLSRQKSISMDQMPALHVDLANNDLFQKQKAKREQEQKIERIQRRKSKSYDELRVLEQRNDHFLRDRSERDINRAHYKTVDVVKSLSESERQQLEDLITDFQFENNPGTSQRIQHFPPVEEEEVVQRRPSRLRVERPRTVGSTSRRRQPVEPPIELKNVKRLEIGNLICLKPLPGESLQINQGRLECYDASGNVKSEIPTIPLQRKTICLVGRKEVEVRDEVGTIYRLTFDTSREARNFVDNLKENSTTKTGASWWLRRFLKIRSNRAQLESKGILKNEPVFGNTLEELCRDRPVPEVVVKLTELIEDERNITSVGLYRASPNLAVMQNIRCEINAGKYQILEGYKTDPDVLSGTLKLFFRELKEPLVTFEVYEELCKVTDDQSDIGRALSLLPICHSNTLSFVIRHLLKVCTYQSENMMDFRNMAISWGPSLFVIPVTSLHDAKSAEFTKITEVLLKYFDDRPDTEDPITEAIRTLTTLIEREVRKEGLYKKKSGKSISPIIELIENRKLSELDKYDVFDLCDTLRKFVKIKREILIPDEFFDWYRKECTEPAEVFRRLKGLPRRETIFLICRHLRICLDHGDSNRLSFEILANLWITSLLPNNDIHEYNKRKPKYMKLFEIIVNGEDFADVLESRVRSHYDNVPEDI